MNAGEPPADLVRITAEVGADPSLVQGAGGNSSLKVADCLWVKASGCWMADALLRPVFVPLSLAAVRRLLAQGGATIWTRPSCRAVPSVISGPPSRRRCMP